MSSSVTSSPLLPRATPPATVTPRRRAGSRVSLASRSAALNPELFASAVETSPVRKSTKRILQDLGIARKLNFLEPTYFDRLPNDLVKFALSFLTPKEFPVAKAVFRNHISLINEMILQEPRFSMGYRLQETYRPLSFNLYTYAEEVYRKEEFKIVGFCGKQNVRHLEFGSMLRNAIGSDNEFLQRLEQECEMAESLVLTRFNFQGIVTPSFRFLEKLELISLNNKTTTPFVLDLSTCTKLEHLVLTEVRQLSKLVLPISLKSIRFTNTPHEADFSDLHSLESFVSAHSNPRGEEEAKHLILPFNLKHLELSHCRYTFDKRDLCKFDGLIVVNDENSLYHVSYGPM